MFQVYVRVAEDSLKIEVGEWISVDNDIEATLHATPELFFTGRVVPKSTQVRVIGSAILISIIKSEPGCAWEQLFTVKFPWVKLDPESLFKEAAAEIDTTEEVEVTKCRNDAKYECDVESESSDSDSDSDSLFDNNAENMKDLMYL